MTGHTDMACWCIRKIYVYFLKKLWYTKLDRHGRGGASVPFFCFSRALVRMPVMNIFVVRRVRHGMQKAFHT